MASVSEFKLKIKSIRSTQQITQTLKMIAGARLAKARRHVSDARLYFERGESLVNELLACTSAAGCTDLPALAVPRQSGPAGVIVICGDKGLCGGFNEAVLSAARSVQARCGHGTELFAVGRKAGEYFRRYGDGPVHSVATSEAAGAAGLRGFLSAVLTEYERKGLREVRVVYSEIKTVMHQEVRDVRLVPVEAGYADRPAAPDRIFDPCAGDILRRVVPEYVLWKLRLAVVESCAAEQAARMNAMDSASRNAAELIEHFTLSMNTLRQSLITRELAEIVGTSEALK